MYNLYILVTNSLSSFLTIIYSMYIYRNFCSSISKLFTNIEIPLNQFEHESINLVINGFNFGQYPFIWDSCTCRVQRQVKHWRINKTLCHSKGFSCYRILSFCHNNLNYCTTATHAMMLLVGTLCHCILILPYTIIFCCVHLVQQVCHLISLISQKFIICFRCGTHIRAVIILAWGRFTFVWFKFVAICYFCVYSNANACSKSSSGCEGESSTPTTYNLTKR